jgi:hypothetical protein
MLVGRKACEVCANSCNATSTVYKIARKALKSDTLHFLEAHDKDTHSFQLIYLFYQKYAIIKYLVITNKIPLPGKCMYLIYYTFFNMFRL